MTGVSFIRSFCLKGQEVVLSCLSREKVTKFTEMTVGRQGTALLNRVPTTLKNEGYIVLILFYESLLSILFEFSHLHRHSLGFRTPLADRHPIAC